MTAPLASAFSESKISRMAGQRAFWRAQMIQRDALENIVSSDDRITATVRGTLPYRTELRVDEKLRPQFSCTCPQGDEGKFCKHLAALALTLHVDSPSRILHAPQTPSIQSQGQEMITYVESLAHEELVGLVLEAATRDELIARRLVLQEPAGSVSVSLDVKQWRSQITAAFGPKSRFIDYRAAPQWAKNILGMVDELRNATDNGCASDVITLLEHAFARTEKAMEHVDDSDGWINLIADDIADGHLDACQRLRPDPKDLARRLTAFELECELDTFLGAAERYAPILGDGGLAAYRQLVDEAEARVGSGETDQWSSPKYRIRQARVGIALATRDPDELIAVLTSERMLPDEYLIIVNALMIVGRALEAIEWARRGLNSAMSTEHYRRDLRDRLVEILAECGEFDEVRDVRLQGFRTEPTPMSLRRYLTTCSEEERGVERLAALAWLEERATEHPGSRTANDLVRILMAEGEIESAFDVAMRLGCDRDLRSTLARAIEKSQPRDAIALHEVEVDELIDRKRRQDYQAAAALLERVHRLYAACDAESEWTTYLAAVVATHKAKSSLIGILRERGVAKAL